jgi:aryl-alcohol dehydrogenase-like predicted oxidoreductase
VKRLSLHTLQRQVVESRTILGGRLHLYQIHSATVESGVLEDRSVLGELARLRESGIPVGLTVTGPHQPDVIRRALATRVDGALLFQTVQATWNLLEPSAGAALADASAEGCGVIVKEVLANGRLTARHAGPALGELHAYAAAQNADLETVCVAAALAQPWADVVLSGAVTCEQLEGHVKALDLAPGAPVISIGEPADVYWCRRAGLAWS